MDAIGSVWRELGGNVTALRQAPAVLRFGGAQANSNVVDAVIRLLRKKLAPDSAELETVRGHVYRIQMPASQPPGTRAPSPARPFGCPPTLTRTPTLGFMHANATRYGHLRRMARGGAMITCSPQDGAQDFNKR